MERWSDDYADYAAYTFGETRASDGDDRLDAFRRDDDDAFELPPLDNFPTQDESLDAFAETPHAYHAELPAFDDYEEHANDSVASEQFVDAETYLANHPVGEDSFLREAAGGDGRDSWIDGGEDIITPSDSRRPSDIFVERSRNMDQVEFTSPKASDAQKQQENPIVSTAKNGGSRMSKEVLSESGTALSSEYDIHFDNRHALTPNSLRYLQLQERERRSQSARVHIPLNLDDSTTGNEHMRHAQQIVGGHVGDSAISLPSSQVSAPSSAEKAMTAGPTVIKRALNEIDSMLHPPDFETDSEASFTLTKLRDKSRLLEAKVRGSFVNLAQESSIRATDDDEFDRTNPIISQPVASDLREEVGGLHPNNLKETQKLRLSGLAHTQTERSNAHEPRLHVNHGLTSGETITSQGPVQSSSPGQHGNRYHDPLPSFANKFEDTHNLHEMPPPIHVSVTSKSPQERMGETTGVLDVKSRLPLSDEMPRITVAHQSTQVLGHQDDARETSTSVVPTCAKVPIQMPRRCRRLLCTVGETMTEEIVFSNGSSRTGRICVSLLPLSTGCQQFSTLSVPV
ncbi:hypothetical protein Poli38472_002070 [Pythium oligandrum]|uniref:Uncharacterized protein n=1 Tax=Pythium oligandrum TaxID=41045 RepID=A0A8K1CGJ6_PYTOL|nr:hypothetical protein Poli38472_002070 [Pythium oligandrum]|eukprot:TMW63129.1 hypothetical protein Poli38472_002070 [Pythium oligandrum]